MNRLSKSDCFSSQKWSVCFSFPLSVKVPKFLNTEFKAFFFFKGFIIHFQPTFSS